MSMAHTARPSAQGLQVLLPDIYLLFFASQRSKLTGGLIGLAFASDVWCVLAGLSATGAGVDCGEASVASESSEMWFALTSGLAAGLAAASAKTTLLMLGFMALRSCCGPLLLSLLSPYHAVAESWLLLLLLSVFAVRFRGGFDFSEQAEGDLRLLAGALAASRLCVEHFVEVFAAPMSGRVGSGGAAVSEELQLQAAHSKLFAVQIVLAILSGMCQIVLAAPPEAASKEAERSSLRQERLRVAEDPFTAKVFMCLSLAVTALMSILVCSTIDWARSHFIIAMLFVLLNSFLLWGVADMLWASISFHVLRLVWGFPKLDSEDFSQGVPTDYRTFVCYCLLSDSQECSEVAFRNAVESYLNNLDPNFNVACGVVSATSNLDVVLFEGGLLSEWRAHIRDVLRLELLDLCSRSIALPSKCRACCDHSAEHSPNAREAFWEVLWQAAREAVLDEGEEVGGGAFYSKVHEKLQDIPERVAANFYWLHRSSQVLRKPGHYQDLVSLTYCGCPIGYTYVDERYRQHARPRGCVTFSLCSNVDVASQARGPEALTYCGTGNGDDAFSRLQELDARMQEDVARLKACGSWDPSFGAGPDTRYKYTIVMDRDTRCGPQTLIHLAEVAAKNPDYGIFQPYVHIDSDIEGYTWYTFLESMRQASSSNLSLVMFNVFGRCGFFGKGLISNEALMRCVVGEPGYPAAGRHRFVGASVPTSSLSSSMQECPESETPLSGCLTPVEALPVDILSHDTYEAQLLRPCYVQDVRFTEEAAKSHISALAQSTRWMLGEIKNNAYAPGGWFHRVLGLVEPCVSLTTTSAAWCTCTDCGEVQGDLALPRREPPPFSRHPDWLPITVGTSYLATQSCRLMHTGAAMMLVVILREMLEPLGMLVILRNRFSFCLTAFAVVALLVVPKGLLCLGSRSGGPQTEEVKHFPDNPRLKRLALSLLEVLSSVVLFGPECVIGSLRMIKAYKAHFIGQAAWKPQDQVEKAIQAKLGWKLVLQHTWFVAATGVFFFLFGSDSHFSRLLHISWVVHPLVVLLGCQPLTESQRQWPIVRWVRELNAI